MAAQRDEADAGGARSAGEWDGDYAARRWLRDSLFVAAAVLLVSTTVRLSIFARRREVEVMQLVGATNWFIRWPFLLEGFITGILGSLLAAGAVWALSAAVVGWIHSSKLDFLDARGYPVLLQAGFWPLGFVPTLVLVGALLGTIGSALALGHHLRIVFSKEARASALVT